MFREYQGAIYLVVTQGDSPEVEPSDVKAGKKRIMFGKLEDR